MGYWVARRAVSYFKEHLTYPRTGFVAYPRAGAAGRVIAAVVAVVVGAAIAVLLRLRPGSVTLIPVLQGLPIGIFLIYLAYTLGVSRFYVLAAISLAVGLASSLSGLDESLGSAIYFGPMGVALVVSGAITLRSYLLQTQPPAKE